MPTTEEIASQGLLATLRVFYEAGDKAGMDRIYDAVYAAVKDDATQVKIFDHAATSLKTDWDAWVNEYKDGLADKDAELAMQLAKVQAADAEGTVDANAKAAVVTLNDWISRHSDLERMYAKFDAA